MILEFDFNFVYVKDKTSRKLILCRTLKNGLYWISLLSFNPPTPPTPISLPIANYVIKNCYCSCFNSRLSGNNIWHLRLGHPLFSFMKMIVNSCWYIQLHNKSDFCSTCPQGKHIIYLLISNSLKARNH